VCRIASEWQWCLLPEPRGRFGLPKRVQLAMRAQAQQRGRLHPLLADIDALRLNYGELVGELVDGPRSVTVVDELRSGDHGSAAFGLRGSVVLRLMPEDLEAVVVAAEAEIPRGLQPVQATTLADAQASAASPDAARLTLLRTCQRHCGKFLDNINNVMPRRARP
jgi:hypothetical protein